MENNESNYKPGVKTTEFWVAIAPVLLGLVEAMKGDEQNSTLIIICGTVLGSIYMASRTLVKYYPSRPSRRASSK